MVLTDEQLTAIYLYAQRGADALRPFRQKAALLQAMQNRAGLEHEAQPADAGT